MDNFNDFLLKSQRLEELREQNHRNNPEFQDCLKKFNTIKGFIELVLPKIFKDFTDSINQMQNLQQTRLNSDNNNDNNSNVNIVRFDKELRWKFFSIEALIVSISQTLSALETYTTTTTEFEQNYRSIFNTTVRNDCDLNDIINDLKNSIDFARRITTNNQDDSVLSINSNDNVGTSSPFMLRVKNINELIDSNKSNLLNFVSCTQDLELYQCKKCNYQTNYFVELQQHYNLHNNNDDKSIRNPTIIQYNCDKCKYETYSKLVLKIHQKCCSIEQNPNNSIDLDEYIDYKCGICKFRTSSIQLFNQHNCPQHFKLFICKRCEIICEKYNDLQQHFNTKHIINYKKCRYCKEMYEEQTKLDRHILKKHLNKINNNNSGGKIYWSCEVCPRQYKSKYGLKTHILRDHNDDMINNQDNDEKRKLWYSCDQCDYRGKQKVNLERHIINNHTDPSLIKWYTCDLCGTFKTKRSHQLKLHKFYRHTPDDQIKWYKCTKCTKFSCKRKPDLQRHLLTQHTDSNQIKWHECQYCDYKAKRKDQLKKHTKIHQQSKLNDNDKKRQNYEKILLIVE